METIELVEKILAGEDVQSSQDELYRRVRQTLLSRIDRKLPARLRSKLDTEDILHDAFLRAMRGLKLFEAKNEKAFFAWVYSIAKNLLIDSCRRRSVDNVHFAQGEDQDAPRASQVVAERRRPESLLQKREWVHSILSQLREKDAEVIRLHKLDGLSFAQIAERWGKTPGAVQRFYSRAAKQFRDTANRSEPQDN
ncbi:MAG: sigma-70 family RNA polymerase sigma factor [Planctomycetota bacterium]